MTLAIRDQIVLMEVSRAVSKSNTWCEPVSTTVFNRFGEEDAADGAEEAMVFSGCLLPGIKVDDGWEILRCSCDASRSPYLSWTEEGTIGCLFGADAR